MKVEFNFYPNGKKKALTMSYDDGQLHDRRLVEIFNTYGIKGTFHLNSGFLDQEGRLTSAELSDLFKGHEISVHTVKHPHLTRVPKEVMVEEIVEDRKRLEELAGYPVRGMSYPFGTYNNEVLAALPLLGIEYSRTTVSTKGLWLPANFLEWHPTCHHNDDLMKRCEEFKNTNRWLYMPLFYVWGHSYEFPRDNNWELIEEFCKAVSNDPDVWYATNIEIVDYVNAMKSLKFSSDHKMVQNQSCISVWISVDGEPVEVKAGELKKL